MNLSSMYMMRAWRRLSDAWSIGISLSCDCDRTRSRRYRLEPLVATLCDEADERAGRVVVAAAAGACGVAVGVYMHRALR